MFVFETGRLFPRYIINFPTKRHWRGKARIEDIEAGLSALVEEIRRCGIRSVALPPLGCGLGGLEWSEVRARIEETLAGLADVRILVFEPTEVQSLPRSMRRGPVPSMTPGRAAMVVLTERYLVGLLDPFISLLEVHKLMYFLQEAGELLRLRFTKGLYGPYAENLRHVLSAIAGYYISGFGNGGDQPDKVLELVPGAIDDARRVLDQQPEMRERFERVGRLVEGFENRLLDWNCSPPCIGLSPVSARRQRKNSSPIHVEDRSGSTGGIGRQYSISEARRSTGRRDGLGTRDRRARLSPLRTDAGGDQDCGGVVEITISCSTCRVPRQANALRRRYLKHATRTLPVGELSIPRFGRGSSLT